MICGSEKAVLWWRIGHWGYLSRLARQVRMTMMTFP
jgi:hypothetical protein